MQEVWLLLSIFTTGIMGGLFFAWSIAVMPGLNRLNDREFLHSMQSMNRAIQNPIFFIAFFGGLLFPAIVCFQYFTMPLSTGWFLLAASFLAYAVGVFGITAAGNVPLNNTLDRLDILNGEVTGLKNFRNHFEGSWNRLNNRRTVFAILSFMLQIIFLLLNLNKSAIS